MMISTKSVHAGLGRGSESKPTFAQAQALVTAAVNRPFDRDRGHLSSDEFLTVQAALIEAIGPDYLERRADLFYGMPKYFTQTLQASPNPIVQLALDLGAFNRCQPFDTGFVPLKKFFQNIVAVRGPAIEDAERVRASVKTLNAFALADRFTGAAARFNHRPQFAVQADFGNGRPGIKVTLGRTSDAEFEAFASAMEEAVKQAGLRGAQFTIEIQE